jgi:FHS family Na+ dependent glucose MFS transporter 1
MDLWGDKASAPMHALHFGYPIGAMIGPLIAYPFVSIEKDNSTTSDTTTISDGGRDYADDSQIEIAFAIVACFLLVLAAMFAVFQVAMPSWKIASFQDKAGYSWREVLSPAKWADGDTKFGITITVFIMLFYFFHVATFKTSSTYYITYAADEMGYSNQDAALLSSAMSFAGMAGRGLSIILAKFIPIQAMIISEVHLQAFIGVLTLLWGLQTKQSYLICGCLFVFFRDPIWPAAYTWTDQYICLYAIVVGLSDMSAKLADTIFSLSLGYLYENTLPESLFYNTVAAGICHCILIIVMNVVGEKHGRRFKKSSVESITESKECIANDDEVTRF